MKTKLFVTTLILMLFASCSYEYLDCEVDYLLPGMWSGPVDLHHDSILGTVSVDAVLHLQLFDDPERPGWVRGWAYFSEGSVDLDGFPAYPCSPVAVAGELVPNAENLQIDCLEVEGVDFCLEFEGDRNGGRVTASFLVFSLSDYISNFEHIGEREMTTFRCIR